MACTNKAWVRYTSQLTISLVENGLADSGIEGDVEDVMARPIGDGADVQAEKEKWYGRQYGFKEIWSLSDFCLLILGTLGTSSGAYHERKQNGVTYLLS